MTIQAHKSMLKQATNKNQNNKEGKRNKKHKKGNKDSNKSDRDSESMMDREKIERKKEMTGEAMGLYVRV